jgi:PAS domain-containing protein
VEKEGGYTMPAMEYARRFVHPDDMHMVRLETERAVQTTDPNYTQSLDHRIVYADGESGFFNVNIRVEKDAQGRTVRTHGANMDITGRKMAEEHARHLAKFPELNPNPVLEFSADGRLVYHNPAALAMAREVGCPDLADLLPPAVDKIVVDCLGAGKPRLRLETQQSGHTLSWSFYPLATQRVVHCYVRTSASGNTSRDSFARRRRWRRSASWPGAWHTTSTTC